MQMFEKPQIFSNEKGSHVIGRDGKIKKSFPADQHGASHASAANLHLQQNYHDYMREAKDSHEYDYEGEMALNQLNQMMHHVNELKSMLKPNTNLPEWVQLKITLAADYIQTAADYLNGEMKEEADLEENKLMDAHFDKQTPKVQGHLNALMRQGHSYPEAVKKVKNATPIATNEAVKNPYAIGMAAAEKSTGDTPPLKKSTITKAHKIAKEVMKENKFLAGALKRLEEGRGRPPKEGSAAWHRRQAEQNKPKEESVALGIQLRKAKSINAPVTFDNGETHQVHPGHVDKFNDHMAARKTTQEKDDFQKRASASHEAFKKAVSQPLPNSRGGGSEVVKYRH